MPSGACAARSPEEFPIGCVDSSEGSVASPQPLKDRAKRQYRKQRQANRSMNFDDQKATVVEEESLNAILAAIDFNIQTHRRTGRKLAPGRKRGAAVRDHSVFISPSTIGDHIAPQAHARGQGRRSGIGESHMRSGFRTDDRRMMIFDLARKSLRKSAIINRQPHSRQFFLNPRWSAKILLTNLANGPIFPPLSPDSPIISLAVFITRSWILPLEPG